MVEQIGAIIGAIVIFSKIVGVIKSLLFVEENLKKLANKPVDNREAIIYEHELAGHTHPLKACWQDTCAGLA